MKRFIILISAIILLIICTVCVARNSAIGENQRSDFPAGTGNETSSKNYSEANTSVSSDRSNLSGQTSIKSVVSINDPPENVISHIARPDDPPTITQSQNAELFYNLTDNVEIASKNADKYIAPASLLKLLTAATALKYVSPDKVITVGTELELVPPGSSLCLIAKGHSLTLHDLLTGMLLASGNDAAYTVAVSVAREVYGGQLSDSDAVEYFTDLMNKFARELGMNNSFFVNPDGSDDERQFTTANDLLLLARYVMTIPEIREITGIHEKYVVFESGQNITWTNSNKLLDPENSFYCSDALGLKTGTTILAGYNLIASFKKSEKMYVVVLIGCESDRDRYNTALEYYSLV